MFREFKEYSEVGVVMLSVSHAEKIILDLVQSGWTAGEVVTLLTAIERFSQHQLSASWIFPLGQFRNGWIRSTL